MTRTPLRPLARVSWRPARSGENPDAIERENIRKRHEDMKDKRPGPCRRPVAGAGRVLLLRLLRHWRAHGNALATSEAQEPLANALPAACDRDAAWPISSTARGAFWRPTFETYSVFMRNRRMMVDPVAAAEGLVKVFPDLDKDRLVKDFTGKRKFLWIKKRISPEQKQAVHDIGDPGHPVRPARNAALSQRPHLRRMFWAGPDLAAKASAPPKSSGLRASRKQFDSYLRDPANGQQAAGSCRWT